MEKKVIDLRDCKEDVLLYLPVNFKYNDKPYNDNGYEVMEITMPKDPFDLVPKSWEEFLEKNQQWLERSYFNIPVKEQDIEAFVALIKLRLLWHEWVKVLGTPKEQKYIIYWDFNLNEIAIDYTGYRNSPLSFQEKSHAEKFIECFGELLDEAKILL